MTKLESSQPDSSFLNAGYKAYYLGIPQLNNPYARTSKASLWELGWKRAQNEDKPSIRKPIRRNNSKPNRTK